MPRSSGIGPGRLDSRGEHSHCPPCGGGGPPWAVFFSPLSFERSKKRGGCGTRSPAFELRPAEHGISPHKAFMLDTSPNSRKRSGSPAGFPYKSRQSADTAAPIPAPSSTQRKARNRARGRAFPAVASTPCI